MSEWTKLAIAIGFAFCSAGFVTTSVWLGLTIAGLFGKGPYARRKP
jgi:hypothetical protein